MIINYQKKYVIMRPAKTGSTTLFNLINKQTQYCFTVNQGAHLPATHLTEVVKETFNIYAFYRDPYTRFLSRWQAMIHNYKKFFIVNYKKQKTMPCVLNDLQNFKQNPNLTQIDVTLELIDSVSIAEFLQHIAKSKYVFCYQHYFHTPNTILFSYENYETNVRDLLSRLGLNSSVDIPRLNSTYNQEVYDKITSNEKQMIIDYYKPEYDYFASRGIYFESNK